MEDDDTMDKAPAEHILFEERVIRPLPQFVMEANLKPAEVAELRDAAADDPQWYWEEAADELEWFRKWDRVLDEDDAPFYRWFPGARCNIVHNALDRHITTANKNKLALIWEGEPGDTRKYTYFELHREVNRFAGALRGLGVAKGDRVALYLPPLPETVIAMLAAAKIGAVHTFVFAGFSAKALAGRVADAGARVLVTADGFYRNGRVVRLKENVDAALALPGGENVRDVVVVRRTGQDVDMREGRDHWYGELVRNERAQAPTEVMDAGDPLFMLSTPGATGRPKGVVHAHGGYMVGVSRTFSDVFDIKPTDIFWCAADPGWITGHTAGVYGPLLAGTTSVLYEGHPDYPRPDRLWSIIERYGVTIFYTAPTAIRMLMRHGEDYPAGHDLTSLRLIGTVGEAISPEAWDWLHRHVGGNRCPVLDTWWQTETGMPMVAPMPVAVLKPGSVARPLPGVDAQVVNPDGTPAPDGASGHLVIARPWPAMFTGIDGDPAAYRAYWERIPGVYFAGDSARRDEDGYIWIQGRTDDVLIIAGHRLGTAELEGALFSHDAVADVAVIGVPDRLKGEAAKAFVVLADDFDPEDELADELKAHVRDELGPVAVLSHVEFRESLPKTSCGKLLRRVLKSEEFGLEREEDVEPDDCWIA
jgi:acetyl-CoA synthetase